MKDIPPGEGQLREGVGRDVDDGGVGEELHDHAHVIGRRIEHHRTNKVDIDN